jgi:hypothetical protein
VEQIIIQYDDVNNKLLEIALKHGINAAPLFDLSHGAGVLPKSWPKPVALYCGYAGGLSPENLEEQIQKIKKAARGRRYWIDAETKLRTEPYFDSLKCTQFLGVAEKHLNPRR